ncbi:hypothetical protein H072_10099 [Dactylellina haptotyla CBS 200.50]|uniref:SWI5-dependent HO expression protein 3 n=1 Tax=Dactylellina haptotyla (strain CBS 200.50) TaxID=1284197 RepID=S8BMF9_DACHA|nr:hypothetical protein H072_10099 [Dactylellina haptotyla CBS 200.50]
MADQPNAKASADANKDSDQIEAAFSAFINHTKSGVAQLKSEVLGAAQTQRHEAAATIQAGNQAITKLLTELEATEGKYKSQVKALEEDLGSAHAEASAKAKSYTTTLKDLKSSAATHEITIQNLNRKIQDMRTAMASEQKLEDNTELAKARKQIFTDKQRIEELEAGIKVAKEAYLDLVDSVTAHQSDSDLLETKLRDSEKEISALKRRLETFNTNKEEASKLRNEVNALKNTLATHRGKQVDLVSKMEKLQAEKRKAHGLVHRRGLMAEVMRNTIQNLEADNHRWKQAAVARFNFASEEQDDADLGNFLNSKIEQTLKDLMKSTQKAPPDGARSAPNLRPNAVPFRPAGNDPTAHKAKDRDL